MQVIIILNMLQQSANTFSKRQFNKLSLPRIHTFNIFKQKMICQDIQFKCSDTMTFLWQRDSLSKALSFWLCKNTKISSHCTWNTFVKLQLITRLITHNFLTIGLVVYFEMVLSLIMTICLNQDNTFFPQCKHKFQMRQNVFDNKHEYWMPQDYLILFKTKAAYRLNQLNQQGLLEV